MPTVDASTLEGRVILVTGGARGLGFAIAQILHEAGANILLADLREDEAVNAASKLGLQRVTPIFMDVGDEASVRDSMREIAAPYGRLDAIINNAGTDITAPLTELAVADWDRVVRTNLTGPFLVSKYGIPVLSSGGHIVNIASTAARRAWPNASVYHASKWGLLGLSHAMHAELRPQKIKVSAIIAGGMKTPFLLDRFPDIDESTLQDPRNVANAVRFVLMQPEGTVIPEVMVLPMKETSWP